MLLSIFTPTHYPTYLLETYRSIQRQSWTDWEWILLPNGPGASIPAEIRQDPRVRIVHAGSESKIGALKRLACDRARGAAFIELDHDDMLMPGDTLAVIANLMHRGSGFVHSDTAVFRPDRLPHSWDSVIGWESYPIKLYGRKLQASRAFAPTPRSLCEVGYAPDHIRCWSRSAYYRVGGHDASMAVGDDHDLVCRTYLDTSPFSHTGGCHYLYRLHRDNTFRTARTQLSTQIIANREKYLGRLIRTWCKKEQHEIVNVDDMVRSGWKWDRDLYHGFGVDLGAIICTNCLQFCPPHLVTEFMNQAYDALLPGGYLEICVPSADSRAGLLHPQALSHFSYVSFFPYTRKSCAVDPQQRCRFQLIQSLHRFPDDFHKEHNLQYVTITLAALKGQRQPGTKHI